MVAEPSRRVAMPAYGAVTDPTATSGSRDDDDVRWNTQFRTELDQTSHPEHPQGVLGKPRRVVRRLHLHRVRQLLREAVLRTGGCQLDDLRLRHLRGHLPHAASRFVVL